MRKIFLVILIIPSLVFGGGFEGYKTNNPTEKRLIEMYESLDCDYTDTNGDFDMGYTKSFRQEREVLCSIIINDVNASSKAKKFVDKNSDE